MVNCYIRSLECMLRQQSHRNHVAPTAKKAQNTRNSIVIFLI